MMKFNKAVSIVVIFVMIGVFLCADTGYSETLRVPIGLTSKRIELAISSPKGKIKIVQLNVDNDEEYQKYKKAIPDIEKRNSSIVIAETALSKIEKKGKILVMLL